MSALWECSQLAEFCCVGFLTYLLMVNYGKHILHILVEISIFWLASVPQLNRSCVSLSWSYSEIDLLMKKRDFHWKSSDRSLWWLRNGISTLETCFNFPEWFNLKFTVCTPYCSFCVMRSFRETQDPAGNISYFLLNWILICFLKRWKTNTTIV